MEKKGWQPNGACFRCTIHSFLVRVRGIEPRSNAWEAFVLPLNYTRKRGSEIELARISSERRGYMNLMNISACLPVYHHENALLSLSKKVGGGGGGVELESTITIMFSPCSPTEYSWRSAASLPRWLCNSCMFCCKVDC